MPTGVPAPSAVQGDTLEDRILAAAIRCVARWGVAKTTLDDIAREAGCSRATVYRVVPGGRDALLEAAGDRELLRLFGELAGALDATTDLEDLLVTCVHRAAVEVAGHHALQYLLTHEPEHLLPWVAFDGLDPLLAASVTFARPFLARHLPEAQADEVAEWLARLLVTFVLDPTEGGLDLTRRADAEHVVRTYVLPGVAALAA